MYLYYKFNFMVLIFSHLNQKNRSFIQQKNKNMVINTPKQIMNPNMNQKRDIVILKPPSLLNFNMYDIMNHNKTNCESCGK